LIREAPCVEFRDGLHTVREVAEAVVEGFDGILDMSICNSAILERAIKSRNRSCLVIVNETRAHIASKMIRYKLIIQELDRAPSGYVDVVRRVHSVKLRGERHL
jgi:hypothetical protein